jgi:hypothetical protein
MKSEINDKLTTNQKLDVKYQMFIYVRTIEWE